MLEDIPTTASKVSIATAGKVPIGGIIMWSGTIAAIPIPVWQLCDGTANTPGPDLRDKFIVGAKQDDAGVAKSNILGVLSQSGGATGHSHSGHAALSHTGASVGDHTGLTHGLSVANHPDLTHVALASHPALSLPGLTHADLSVPGYTHPLLTIEGQTHAGTSPGATHPLLTIEGQSHAVLSIADMTVSGPGLTHSVHGSSAASVASGTPSRWTISYALTAAHPSHPASQNVGTLTAWSISPASHPTYTASAPAIHPTGGLTINSHPTFTASAPASHAALTITRASHPTYTADGLAHGGVGTHVGTDYGVHTFTAPAAHGTAGTVTHSFTEDSAHAVSVHDTVTQVPSFFALAFIQRML